MKTSSKRILSILFSAFFLIGAFTVYGSLIRPEIESANKLQSIVASKTNLYNGQKAAVAQVADLIGQFQSAARLQQTVGLAVPIGPNTTQALNQWQAISAASQVRLQSLDIQSGQPLNPKAQSQSLVKKLNIIPTQVDAIGSYGSLKQFLNSVEANARVMNISSFGFKSAPVGQGGAGSGDYSLELSLTAFYQEN